ncbi:vacuolar-type H+-ATPase subunit H [Labrenzia sp. EL_142]|nr:vacuolar-type H+-ATPase subunit H [Labrenzia sp. EL_142]
MLQTTRMLAWISFFQKIRIDDAKTKRIHDATQKYQTISGTAVFKELVPDSVFRVAEIKQFETTTFRPFNEIEGMLMPVKGLDSELQKAIFFIDIVAISLECAGDVVLPELIQEALGNNEAAKTYALLYASVKAAVVASEPNLFQKQKVNLEQHFEKVRAENTERIKTIVKIAEQDIRTAHDEMRSTVLKELRDERQNVVNAATKEIEKYKREAGATLVVKNANQLWNDKARTHRWVYIGSGITFAVLVVASIALPIAYWQSISSEILKLEPLFEGHVFGAVVIILIPVLGVAWVLRLLSRFTTQNMMLADDAQLRRVMAETFVKLVSEDAIKDPQDRAIILTALFLFPVSDHETNRSNCLRRISGTS